MAKVFEVSYLIIGGYVGFVVVATLLVGLLPALVNLPYCDDPARANLLPLSGDLPSDHVLHKRDAEKPVVNSKLFEERQARGIEVYQSEMKSNPIFRRLMGSRVPIAELKECPELTAPIPSVDYPWYEERLPDYIKAVNYNIELLLNDPSLLFYDGFINVTFDVTQPDKSYVLLHNGVNDNPLIVAFVDRNGQDVELNCIGNFPYLRNDYYIIKTEQPLDPARGPFTVKFLFLDFYSGVDNGIFRLTYNDVNNQPSNLFLSKFRPIDARRAYPCFDEPGYRATYDVTIFHRNDYAAAFNTPVKNSFPDPDLPNIQTTVFLTTPPMPSDYIAYTIFKLADFGSLTKNTVNGNIPVTIWARKQYVDDGFAKDALDLYADIFNQFLDLFRTAPETFPPKIDIFVTPEYPVAGIGHFGLPIIREDQALFKIASCSERDQLNSALIMGRLFAEFWFGNYISHAWWDQLWTQEGFADYVKYRAIDQARPGWNILQQFVVNEVVETIISDGYPSSHPVQKPINNPYEIEEYFDSVETSKTAAILKMIENEFNWAQMENALVAYIKATPWNSADITAFYRAFGTIGPNQWPVEEFVKRWVLQANYPLVYVEILNNTNNNTQSLRVVQSRALNSNSSIFAGELLYPSPYDFIWYVPLECSFGDGTGQQSEAAEREFYLDTKENTFPLPTRGVWSWVHCDRKFTGYYELQYQESNWLKLGQAMASGNFEILADDRAQILHNLFLNSYTERSSYYVLSTVIDYIRSERDYLPWRVVYIHLNRMASILQYRKAFYELSTFMSLQVRGIELAIDPWSPGQFHLDELLKETIIHIACSMQDPFCINNVTALWPQAFATLASGNFENSPIPAFARKYVYAYHMENTYDVLDWDLIYKDYRIINDEKEQRRLMQALSYSRLPWLLYRHLNGPTNTQEDYMKAPDFFDIAFDMAPRPLGRELVWDLYRDRYLDLIEDYSEDDPRLGLLMLELSQSFETEFLFYELLTWAFSTTTGAAGNARFKALELVSTNLVWLQDKENEIRCAFSIVGFCEFKNEVNEDSSLFIKNAREAFLRHLKETELPMFAELKKKLLA